MLIRHLEGGPEISAVHARFPIERQTRRYSLVEFLATTFSLAGWRTMRMCDFEERQDMRVRAPTLSYEE